MRKSPLYLNNKIQTIPQHIKHVVIKLNLIGGENELDTLTKLLDEKGLTYNLGSTFEGLAGIQFLNYLSELEKYKNMKIAGIDTLKYLKKKEGVSSSLSFSLKEYYLLDDIFLFH